MSEKDQESVTIQDCYSQKTSYAKVISKTSFLSPYVEKIFVGMYQKCQKQALLSVHTKPSSCQPLCLKTLFQTFSSSNQVLSKNTLKSQEDFIMAAESLCFLLFDTVTLTYDDKEVDLYSDLLATWLDSHKSECIREWFSQLNEGKEAERHLHLLQMTAALEHGLGNLYLGKASPCPFLIKDLIHSEELSSIFGEKIMQVFIVIFGGPLSLNLRNLLWHGFLVQGELPQLYLTILLFMLVYCSDFLAQKNLFHLIHHRKLVQKSEEINLLRDKLNECGLFELDSKKLILLFQTSSLVSSSSRFLFEFSIDLYEKKKFGDCVIMLLPRIESLLRCRYAWCNQCPHRVLTAQSSELYTTIDEVLRQNLDDGSENKLIGSLDDGLLLVIMDLFTLPDGVRLRDHLSHGEMVSQNIDKTIASILLVIAVLLAHQPCDGACELVEAANQLCDKSCSCHGSTIFEKFAAIIRQYSSLFHPLAITRRTALSCLHSCLSKVPITHPDVPDQASPICELFRSRTSQYLKKCVAIDDLEEGIKLLLVSRMKTMYRDHPHNIIMRRISSRILSINRNLDHATAQRRQKFEERRMRSRQRKNYQRLIYSLPIITQALTLISCFVLASILSDDFLRNLTSRNLKSILQICENSDTFTSLDVNKWDECVALLSKLSELL